MKPFTDIDLDVYGAAFKNIKNMINQASIVALTIRDASMYFKLACL